MTVVVFLPENVSFNMPVEFKKY